MIWEVFVSFFISVWGSEEREASQQNTTYTKFAQQVDKKGIKTAINQILKPDTYL